MKEMILRYELRVGENNLELPDSAVPVHVAAREGDAADRVQMWMSVSSEFKSEPKKLVRFNVVATGEATEGAYVGTVLARGGRLVWHVFYTM